MIFRYVYQLRINKQVFMETVPHKVSTITPVPTDEQPIIATITNATKVNDQDFFSDAENGDILLYYKNAQKTILYRPSVHKIINISNTQISINQ